MKVKKSAKILNISILIILCIILFSGCSTKDISKSNLYDNINNDSYSPLVQRNEERYARAILEY